MGFVDSHLVDLRALVFASLVVIAAQSAVALVNDSAWLWGCIGLTAAVSTTRLYFMLDHARSRPSRDMKAARRREVEYAFGVMAYIGALGSWALVTFCVSEDGFSRLLATTLAISYTFGMWTRSFAISRGNNLQILAAFVPLSAAMLVAGGNYPGAILFGLVPLSIYVKGSSDRLRSNFLSVVAAQSQSALLAKRLDMALNNMSHGLLISNRARACAPSRSRCCVARLSPRTRSSGCGRRWRGPPPGSTWSRRSRPATTARSKSPSIA